LLGLLLIVSCSNQEKLVQYVCSNGSVVDYIEECEVPLEVEQEVDSETTNYSYDADLEIVGIDANSNTKNTFNLYDISFQIKNNGDILDDLNLKVEIWLYDSYNAEGKEKIKEGSFKLFEEKNLTTGTFYNRKFLNLQTYPSLTGLKNPKVRINFLLYQGNILLSNDTKYINILNKEGSISVVFPENTKSINIDSITLDQYSILPFPFEFNYNNINKELSKDAQFRFSITGSDDYDIEYTIENIGNRNLKGGDLILDYYCEREIDSDSFSVLIYDYYSFIEDLVFYKINQEEFSVLPETLYPGEKIILYLPKIENCDKNILLIRKDTSYYCRG